MKTVTTPLIEGKVMTIVPEVEYIYWGDIVDKEWTAFATWNHGASTYYINKTNPRLGKVIHEDRSDS